MPATFGMSRVGALGLASAFLIAGGACATESSASWQTPAIAGYGKIYTTGEKDAAYSVSPHTTSKLVFEIAGEVKSPARLDPELESVARSINLLVADGMPLDHLKCVVMLGRDSAALALNDQRYRERFGVANPNLDLLSKLHAAGVQLVVSEQALADRHWRKSDLTQSAAMALSSLTAVSALVQNGYTVMPL